MKSKKLLLVLMLVSINISKASDCYRLNKFEVFNNADGIFLGEVLSVTDTSYQVRIIEMYKGNYPDTISGVINYDVMTPERGSIWLFYATNLMGNEFIAPVCSGSKSFKFPHGMHDIAYKVPPPPNLPRSPSPTHMFILELIFKDQALNELYFEISGLRHYKMQERIGLLETNNIRLNSQLEQVSQYNKIIIGLVGLLIVLQLFFTIRQSGK